MTPAPVQKKSQKPLVSITIPVLNEASNITRLYERLTSIAAHMQSRCNMEFVFSDNHSTDETWTMLTDLAKRDGRVRAIRFSKNRGFQRSILANYLHTRGVAVMQIDADLQDPPEMIESFFDHWEKGYKVIYGIRRKRREGLLISAFRRFGYFVIDALSETRIPRDVGDFRMVDRKVIDALAVTRSSNPYLRGMIAGLGFNQIGIPYDRDARVAGESKFNVARLVRLGLTAVFNHSTVPLRMASIVGLLILFISILGAAYYVFVRLLYPDIPRGFVSTQILILFGIGLNAFLLGIIGEYLLRIFIMMRSDPIAIVEDSLNFEPSELKL